MPRPLALLLQAALASGDPALADARGTDSLVVSRHGTRAAPVVTAVRVPRAPVLDGRLDDDAWRLAEPVSGFRQVEPRDGAPASAPTEVRIAYDATHLYVAARLHDPDPGRIVGRLARRDASTASDLFTVDLDSYHDHRTTFRFSVNAAGVRADGVTANDSDQADLSWDPVWDAATHVDAEGWSVELRIPFSQLRFASGGDGHWGVDFTRVVQRTGERQRWSWVPSSESGFASQFGHLVGLRDVPTPRRLEATPYVVARSDHDSDADPRNPFDDGSLQRVSGGLDLQYGVTSDVTLVATFNPDFGQVEADPAEVNLTAFESFFQERRPFFVEGASILAFGAGASGSVFGAPQLFYSRRVGRTPSRVVSDPVRWVDQPEATTILGAAKLSGQMRGWSAGVLSAVTAREEARLRGPDGAELESAVEPLTHYGVARLRRDFRGGRSGLGLVGTAVQREALPAELRFLRAQAYVGGIDAYHRFGGDRFSVGGTASLSHVAGDSLAMALTQQSSARYYQRPDQDYVRVDPSARSQTGYALSLSAGKVAGDWLWGSDAFAYSPGFEINDAGFQNQVDRIFHGLRLTRRWLRPSRHFRQAQISLNGSQQWNFGGDNVARGLFPSAYVQFHNQWSATLSTQYSFQTLSDKATRGGPLLEIPAQWNVSPSLSTDPRKRVSGSLSGAWIENRSGGFLRQLSADVTVRPSSAVSIGLSPSVTRQHSAAGWIGARRDALATATYGTRYLFAELDQEAWDLTMRADWALTPTTTLQLYAQPFVAMADFERFKEFTKPSGFGFREFGRDDGSTIARDAATGVYTADPDGPAGPAAAITFGDPDFRQRSLRANLVLRWEYRPGSQLFVTWAHGRAAAFADAQFSPGAELGDLFGDEQRNRLIVKASYWLSR